jgi:hypothetical protein
LGVTVKVAPVPTWLPPQEPVYQNWVPNAPCAVKVVLCPAQIVVEVAVIPVGEGVVPAQFVDL